MSATIEVEPVLVKAAPDVVDLDGVYDEARGITYIGKAKRVAGDLFRCYANVQGALCIVEVVIRPRGDT